MDKYPINKFTHFFSSQIRPIKILLPKREQRDEDDDRNFIGREVLMDKLYNWICDRESKGSFLVTGFRGMGKTSMVNRVLSRLTMKIRDWKELCGYVSIICLLIAICSQWIIERDTVIGCSIIFSLALCVSVLLGFLSAYVINKKFWNRIIYPNRFKFKKRNVNRMVVGDDVDKSHASYHNLRIGINLGHEVLKERDVLSIVAGQVREQYKRFYRSVQVHFLYYYVIFGMSGLSAWWFCDLVKNVCNDSASKILTYGEYVSTSPAKLNIVSDNWFAREFYNLALLVQSFVTVQPVLSKILLYCFLVFISWLIIKKILALLPLFSTPIRAIKRLNTLSERIVATMDEESGSSSSIENGAVNISLLSRRRRKSIPKADVREIEQELSSAINMISEKCWFGFSANFIIVFDEMDKIDPEASEVVSKEDMPEYTDSVKGFPGGLDSMGRRRNVLRLLANMKLFLSTANAKFIFISGRELYDAYLADLSDRDYSISSIFSGVLNVDSFLSPEDDQSDVKSMAEWYIAKQLLPDNYLRNVEESNARDNEVLKRERPSLKWYYQYLFESIREDDEHAEEKRRDVIHVVMFLHIYAAYLTHISNGSPKKMFLYFSKYKRKNVDVAKPNDWEDICEVGEDEGDDQDVLWFDPVQQKTISFVHYLTDSFMQTITNDYSRFGDRFLVSLTFIIDHLYKHHSRAFSWRNLEQIPDLFKTNRAPELRSSLASIMEYLTQLHIAKIPIGLNEFKFKQSISEEISLLSKMSDEASALFNFTLDESSSVIQHNVKMLRYYMDMAKSDQNANGKYDVVLARIHANLGDLHFWDEDYYNAALEYRNAIQLLRSAGTDDDKRSFLSIVRCSLKMGLTYESRKLYLNAYQNYCNLVDYLIEKRWIEEENLGLSIVDERVGDWRGKRRVLVYNNTDKRNDKKSREDIFKEQFGHAQYNREEKQYEYSVNVDGMLSSFAKDLTKEKSKIIARLTLFEEVRYLYQVILAKLSIIEKMEISGITQTNIDVAEGEFNILHKSVNLREKFVISADFFRKLAELLYYKNSLTLSSTDQNSLYSTLYYDEIDLMANIDDFCREENGDAVHTKEVLRGFIYGLQNSAIRTESTDIRRMYQDIKNNDSIDYFEEHDRNIIRNYCDRNINKYIEKKPRYHSVTNLKRCAEHRAEMRQRGLRTPCLACKYYNRSLRIFIDNMFRLDLQTAESKSVVLLRHSFKEELLYASSNHIDMLGNSVEGMGNIMLSCTANDDKNSHILTLEVVRLINNLLTANEEESHRVINQFETTVLTRLDKCLLYYLDAYRIYQMVDHYDLAVDCLKKIVTVLCHYIKVVRVLANNYNDDAEIVRVIIGGDECEMQESMISRLYGLIVRYTAFNYDFSNHSEMRDLRWIYSRKSYQDVDLMFLSMYPDLRTSMLRAIQIIADGIRYIDRVENDNVYSDRYIEHITKTYRLIAPSRRFETTTYNDVYALFSKSCYNEHIMNCLLGDNIMTSGMEHHENGMSYYGPFRMYFYVRLLEFLRSDDERGLQRDLFGTDGSVNDKLELIEYLICDSLVCLSNITRLVTQHNHLSSYTQAFVGLVHNYMWEWSQKYESILRLYKYNEIVDDRARREEVELLLNSVASKFDDAAVRQRFRDAVEECSNIIDSMTNEKAEKHPFGRRSDRLYARLRRDIDDVTINTIFSNYSAESAINYYTMAEEENTEGDAYKDMVNAMHFLDDDFNNDTSQFNLACERFLLNYGVIRTQKMRLERLYKPSRVYGLTSWMDSERTFYQPMLEDEYKFENSRFENSEY